jgi:hypothetical protein
VDENLCRRARNDFGLEVDVRDGRLWLSRRGTRQWGLIIAALLLGGMLMVVPLFIPMPLLPEASPGADTVGRAVKVTSMLFGLSLLLVAAYLPFAGMTVRVGRASIECTYCWFGIAFRRRSVRPEELDDLRVAADGQPDQKATYDLIGQGAFGKFRLLGSIPDREFLESLRRQIMLAAGVRPSGTH